MDFGKAVLSQQSSHGTQIGDKCLFLDKSGSRQFITVETFPLSVKTYLKFKQIIKL